MPRRRRTALMPIFQWHHWRKQAADPFLLGRTDDDLFFAQLNGTDLIKQLVFAIHHRHRIAEEKTSIWHHVGIYWHSSDRSAFRRRRNFPACDLNGIIAGCKNRIAKNGSLNGDTAIP